MDIVDNLLQDPFTVYKYYIATKQHFNTIHFDITKYGAKGCNAKRGAFDKRRDKFFFYYLATKLNENDNTPFFTSQFVDNNDLWVGDILFEKQKAESLYRSWLTRIELLWDNYIIDINNLKKYNLTWKEILISDTDNHPIIFQLVSQNKITKETYTVLNKLFGFIDMSCKDDTFFKQINLKFKKYESILNLPIQKIIKLTPKDLTS